MGQNFLTFPSSGWYHIEEYSVFYLSGGHLRVLWALMSHPTLGMRVPASLEFPLSLSWFMPSSGIYGFYGYSMFNFLCIFELGCFIYFCLDIFERQS